MNVLLVTNNYTPYSSGIVSSLNALVIGLQAQNHEVLLVTLDFMGREHQDPIWVRRIPSVFRFRYKQNHMAVPWRAAYYIERWMEEFAPDVVHVHHPFLLGPIAVECAKRQDIRTVFTYHTMYEQYAHYVPVPSVIVRPIIAQKIRDFCATMDHVIVPSRGIEKLVCNMGVSHTSVIPSALQEQFLQETFNEKKISSPYQLLYVGRLTPEKNITFLLEVMAELPEQYQLNLVGYGTHADYLKNYAYEMLSLSHNQVRFVTSPSKQDLLNYYRKSHLFLFASQTDTQGLVLAESMACSTPVIALQGIGQADIICNGVNGFLVNSQQGMKQTIVKVCSDQESYRLLQEGAYRTAARYSANNVIERVIRVYLPEKRKKRGELTKNLPIVKLKKLGFKGLF